MLAIAKARPSPEPIPPPRPRTRPPVRPRPAWLELLDELSLRWALPVALIIAGLLAYVSEGGERREADHAATTAGDPNDAGYERWRQPHEDRQGPLH